MRPPRWVNGGGSVGRGAGAREELNAVVEEEVVVDEVQQALHGR